MSSSKKLSKKLNKEKTDKCLNKVVELTRERLRLERALRRIEKIRANDKMFGFRWIYKLPAILQKLKKEIHDARQ